MSNRDRKPSSKNASNSSNATVWVAIIGGLVTIIVAILGFPPLVSLINSKWNPTPTIIASPLPTEIVTATPDFTPIPKFTATTPVEPTGMPAAPLEPTEVTSNGKMEVQLRYNYAIGNPPLQVTFNAHSSYLIKPDGTTEECTFTNVCTYTWDVRQGGTKLHGPENGGGVFSYTFSKKGEYTVVVYVCRSNVCDFAAANIMVK